MDVVVFGILSGSLYIHQSNAGFPPRNGKNMYLNSILCSKGIGADNSIILSPLQNWFKALLDLQTETVGACLYLQKGLCRTIVLSLNPIQNLSHTA